MNIDKIIICLIVILAFVCGALFGSVKQAKLAAQMTSDALTKTFDILDFDKDFIKVFMNIFLTNIKEF